MALSLQDIQHIARLARIRVTEAEAEAARGQLNSIFGLIEQMQAVDTAGVEPMSHALDVAQRLREDKVSESDLRELGALRLLLETHAMGLSLAAGDLEWEGRVVAAHHKLAAIEKRLLEGESNRTSEWIRYDRSFHEALISACGSRALMALHSSVFDRFVRYHMLAGSFRGRPVADDHQALLEAALARDSKTAQRLLEAHVQKGIEHVMASGRN